MGTSEINFGGNVALVKDLKRHKGAKTYWTFRLLLELDGTPLESTGWKYFEETQVIRPPAAKIGKHWIPTICGVDGAAIKRIVAALQKALPDATSEAPAPALGVVEAPDPEMEARRKRIEEWRKANAV